MKLSRQTKVNCTTARDIEILYVDIRVLHLYKKYSEQVIVYAVIVHRTNISYSNEVPSAKHV